MVKEWLIEGCWSNVDPMNFLRVKNSRAATESVECLYLSPPKRGERNMFSGPQSLEWQ